VRHGEIDGWPLFREHALREVKAKRGLTLMVGLPHLVRLAAAGALFQKAPRVLRVGGRGAARPARVLHPRRQRHGLHDHPRVAAIMAENVMRFLERNPDVDILGLSQNDGVNWCECPRCLRLEPRRAMRLHRGTPTAHAAQSAPAQPDRGDRRPAFPDKRFAAMAYSGTLEPPENPRFRLHPNIDLIPALFERMYDRPLNQGLTPDDHRTMNLDYVRTDLLYTCFPDLLRRWRRLVQAGSFYTSTTWRTMAAIACRSRFTTRWSRT